KLKELVIRAKAQSVAEHVYVDTSYEALYPVLDMATRTVYPALAMVARVADEDRCHTVVLAVCRTPEGVKVSLTCGDKFFDCARGLPPKEARERCTKSLVGKQSELVAQMMEGHAVYPL